MTDPKRGDVWWVNFDPSLGGETRKVRPAIVLSNNIANRHLNRIQVVPITSNVDHLYPAEAYVTIQNKPGKAMADQITTATKQRLRNKICSLRADELKAVETAVKLQLGL